MPSKTRKQARAMRAACKSKKPRKGGIPKKVACTYVRHDKAKKGRKR